MKTIRIDTQPQLMLDVAGDGPLVLLLHGIGGNRTNFTEQILALSRHFTAAAWDARGYGDSDDYEGALDFGDFSDDLLRVLEHFGAEQAHFVGVSMGGRIALDFYGRHPQRVASLVLADTSGGGKRQTPEQIRAFLQVRQQPLLDGKTPREIAPDIAQELVGPSTPPEAYARIIESLSRLHAQSYLKTLEAAVSYHGFPALESIAVSCLLLVGAEDCVARPEVMRAMADSIPGAQFQIIEHASHLSNMEQPESFNQALLAFLLQQVTP